MDTWTNVHVATAHTPEEAAQRRADSTRPLDTLGVQVASGSLARKAATSDSPA
ncbi:hypothetical protein GCM10010345_93800 [Streptomyces canarius]|uniref:Uncharacterized protein n=1 Tax=Streptomyces canarius TaxID=285453 RepID=A0ABQ3DC77_9ACTN|nr:hypothetical protein GCM10010345_93800 [Streptomyces canarius]